MWQKAVDFAVKVIDVSEEIETKRKHYRLIEQIEAASTSLALNIAEGKGRYSKKEFIPLENTPWLATGLSHILRTRGLIPRVSSLTGFIQFLYIARASLYETITLLILFYKKNWITDLQLEELEVLAEEISKMLTNLIVSIKDSQN